MYWRAVRFFKRLPYNILYGLQNLCKWFPVIWSDRDWDYVYLYKLLHFKLKNMEYHHRNYGHHVGAEKDADKIKVCKLLLKRLIDDVYYDKTYLFHEKKWGELVLGCENTYDGSFISREKISNSIDDEKENKEAKKLREHEVYLRRQDVNYLFKMLIKHVETWWD